MQSRLSEVAERSDVWIDLSTKSSSLMLLEVALPSQLTQCGGRYGSE